MSTHVGVSVSAHVGVSVSACVGLQQGLDSHLSHSLLLEKNVKITQPLGLLVQLRITDSILCWDFFI